MKWELISFKTSRLALSILTQCIYRNEMIIECDSEENWNNFISLVWWRRIY